MRSRTEGFLMTRFFPRFLVISFVLCGVTGISLQAFAQSPAAGILPFSTQAGGPIDSVDLASSNVFVNLPIRSKQGKIPFSVGLTGNSGVYVQSSGSGTKITYNWLVSFGLAPTAYAADLGASVSYTLGTGSDCRGQMYGYYKNFAIIDATGARHPLPSSFSYVNCSGKYPAPALTTDGSGYTLTMPGSGLSWNIYDASGNEWTNSFSAPVRTYTATDPDGTLWSDSINASTLAVSYIDTLGATALSGTVAGWFSRTGSPDYYQYTDAAGNTQKFSVTYSSFTQKTNFGCSNIADMSSSVAVYLPTTVSNPAAAPGAYNISYEGTPGFPGNGAFGPYTTGRVAKITLPSGGYVSYGYSEGNNGLNCTSEIVPTLTRTLYDSSSGTTSTWTYVNSNTTQPIAGQPQGDFTVTETDPAGNQIVHSFAGEYQTQVAVYEGGCPITIAGCNGGGTLLRTTTTCYNANFTSCAAPSVVPAPPIGQTDVYTSFNGSSSKLVETMFDSYGNTVEVSQYDFGAAMPPTGSPVSDTVTSYGQSWNGTTCTAYPSGTYIYNTPCYSHTMNSSGADVAKTQITYSNTGHPTSTAKWTSGTSGLTSTATYNSNGTVATATDANGAFATYGYNGTGGCSNLLPTSVTVGGLTTSMQWDCNGGVVTKTTDANGQPTSYAYNDPLWRVTSMTDPLGNTTNYNYTPTTFEGWMNFNGAVSTTDALATTDGLGRTIVGQKHQGQGAPNWDSTQTVYKWNSTGAITTQTVPYSGAAGAQAPTGTAVTTTQYDAIGRPLTVGDGGGGTTAYVYSLNDVLVTVSPAPSGENPKRKQLEYDGLGRLTSVCEITSAAGSGSCGQSSSATGFLTKYTNDALGNLLTVQQNVQPGAIGGTQTRSYAYDGLGRMTSESNPETGTTTYTFDTDSTCGTSNGDLVKKVDAAGNVTCYAHDGLHRVTAITYPSGPYAASTPPKTFIYDATTFTCTNGSNVKGRLAEAFTGPSSAKITDIAYCYSPRGEVWDAFESTPNSSGYYHTTASYWANGALNTLGLFNSSTQPLIPTQTYGVDGEGRTASVTAASGQNPLSAATYSPSTTATALTGSLTQVTFGSGDSDSYQYDPNTGRMTQYSFNVNGQSAVGKLSWNGNGTLGQLAITDPFNSQDNQTCNESYDDLARVAGTNCGSVWAQTFSYDAFGNIRKSGSISWMPNYNNPSNNQYQSGWNGASYDANGSLKTDIFNTYTWDAYGDLASANGVAITYDALGRMVENQGGAVQFVYASVGQQPLAVMQGQSIVDAYVPLPGRAFAMYNSSGLFQYNHGDWLGSARLFSTPSRSAIPAMAYAPFGEGYAGGAQWIQFTGTGNAWTVADHENQSGSLEDFMFRRYSPVQGRWISPDPAGQNAVDPTNPQTWNRYAYVTNNPLSLTDPLGLCPRDYWKCIRVAGPPWFCVQWCAYYDAFQLVYYALPGAIIMDGGCFGCGVTVLGALGNGDSGNDCYYALANPCGGGLPPPAQPQNPKVPANPCTQAGNALSPSDYASMGQSAKWNPITALIDLSEFPRGGALDPQPLGASPAYGNYVYGVWMAASGTPLWVALGGAEAYGATATYNNQPMLPPYGLIPTANAENIINGYNAQKSGTLCSTAPTPKPPAN